MKFKSSRQRKAVFAKFRLKETIKSRFGTPFKKGENLVIKEKALKGKLPLKTFKRPNAGFFSIKNVITLDKKEIKTLLKRVN